MSLIFSRSEQALLTAQSLGFKYYGVPIEYWKEVDMVFVGNIQWQPWADAHQAEQLMIEHEIILVPYRPNWWRANCYSRNLAWEFFAETPRGAIVGVTCKAQEAINLLAKNKKAPATWEAQGSPVGVLPTRSPTAKEVGDAIKLLQRAGSYGLKVVPAATRLPNLTPKNSSSTSDSKSEKPTRRRPRKST